MDLRDVEENSHHTLVPLVGRQVEGRQVSLGPQVRKEGTPVCNDGRLRLDGGRDVRQQLPNHLCQRGGGEGMKERYLDFTNSFILYYETNYVQWELLVVCFVVYFGVITSLQNLSLTHHLHEGSN